MTRHCRDNRCTQRRTRVTWLLLPVPPKLIADLHKGGFGGCLSRKRDSWMLRGSLGFCPYIIEKNCFSAIELFFRRSWILAPPSGLGLIGRGLVAFVNVGADLLLRAMQAAC
jgi:hypothetical protein